MMGISQTEVATAGERELLRASVADFVARSGDIGRVRRLRGDPAEYDRTVWRTMAELGWLGALVPEQHGGLGLGLAEAALIAEGLARGLAPEPYTAVAVLAVEALLGGDNEEFKREYLPRVADGSVLPVLAWQEHAGELDAAKVGTRAAPFEGGWRVTGTKRFVAGAAGADAFVVSAATEPGLALFWVERGIPGVAVSLEPLADGRHFATLELNDVVLPRDRMVASDAVAGDAMARAIDHAAVICSAELLGAMTRALDMSLDYMRTRVQFGKPIGSFQALQHRAVDLHIQRELASAVVDEALATLDRRPDVATRAMLASRAKARSADAGLRITREAIQIHGAIGFTDEYDAGLYLKRVMVLAAWLGNASWHRRRYGTLSVAESA